MAEPAAATAEEYPRRVFEPERAALRFPQEVISLIPALDRSDPLADSVIEEFREAGLGALHQSVMTICSGQKVSSASLRSLLDECCSLSAEVDEGRLNRAGRVFFRAGVLGGLTLGTRSLVYGYASPVGNKPLAFTGALENKARRRLAETSRFVSAVCTEGGLTPPTLGKPAAEGFRLIIHVRLMHAQVRQMARRDPRWKEVEWGLPINQHDMLATSLLFGVVFTDGLKLLGLSVSEAEADDYQYLWNHVGRLLGVEDQLLPDTADDARRMAQFIRETQGAPDADSRALVRALLDTPLRQAKSARERRIALAHAGLARSLCRSMLDAETAEGLGLGSGGESVLVSRLRGTMRILEMARANVPRLDRLVRTLGARYWMWSGQRMDDSAGSFVAPDALRGRVRSV